MPVCGARTWVTPDEVVTCKCERGHDDKHQADASFGLVGWREPVCRFVLGNINRTEHVWSPGSTRALIASLQRQLDALDPDAAIAEAERRMVAAQARAHVLSVQTNRNSSALVRYRNEAYRTETEAFDEWLALVEARDAKVTP